MTTLQTDIKAEFLIQKFKNLELPVIKCLIIFAGFYEFSFTFPNNLK